MNFLQTDPWDRRTRCKWTLMRKRICSFWTASFRSASKDTHLHITEAGPSEAPISLHIEEDGML
jgi:hypothetical protein